MNSFQAGAAIGNAVNGAYGAYQDKNAIDDILQQASKTNDPNAMDNIIGQLVQRVAPERQATALSILTGKRDQLRNQAELGVYFPNKTQGNTPPANGNSPIGNQPNLGNSTNPPGNPPIIQGNNQRPQGRGLPSFDHLSDAQLEYFTGNKNPQISKPAAQELKRRIEQAKLPTGDEEYKKGRQASVGKYVQDAITTGDEASELSVPLAEARQAINGDIQAPGVKAILKNNPYGQLLFGQTPDEAKLAAANKLILGNVKNIFGTKPTEREVFILLNTMLPAQGKSKDANLAGLDFIEKINNMTLFRRHIVDQLTNGGQEYIPDLERQVDTQMQPYKEQLTKEVKEFAETPIYKQSAGINETPKETPKESGKIKVKAPNGSIGYMTQQQIDEAKKKEVHFEPIK